MTSVHDIAVIAGDGIGQEVMPAAIRCLERVAQMDGIPLQFTEYGWGSEHFRATGRMMPEGGTETLRGHAATFLGAVGAPDIDDTVTLWGLLIPIRRDLRLSVNLRPVRTLPGVRSPLADADDIDFLIVRENVEGEYSEVGGRVYRGQEGDAAIQSAVFTADGVRRVARFAAQQARARGGTVVSATKSNGIIHTMPFWDEIVGGVMADEKIAVEHVLVDALAARMVLKPRSLDVVVASNLLGDILSDLGSALTGSIGVAPSANIDPSGANPGLFEPVHGSAPDIAGQGIANPIGQLWSGAMMLTHLGHPASGSRVLTAIERTLSDGIMTADLGGSATTKEFTDSLIERLD